MKDFFKKAILVLFVISIVSCSDDDDNNNGISGPAPDTITNFIAENTDYSMLLDALQKTNLDVTLNGTGTFTVFAPNNAAFVSFLNGASLDDVPTDVLTQLLYNHVLGATVTTSDFVSGYISNLATESTSGGNISMYIETGTGVVINGQSTVVTADVVKDNGVIHTVDAVIELPTMLTFVGLDTSLSTLATIATTTDGFDIDFAEELAAEGANFTLLAPDNNAFVELGDISGVPAVDVEQILLNHIIPGVNLSSILTTSFANTLATYGDTANNLSIYISTNSGVSFNGESTVSTADIVASNGVIHKVDAVVGLPDLSTFVKANPLFSTLSDTMDGSSLNYDTLLSRPLSSGAPAPYTLFVPVNTAFDGVTLPTDNTELNYIIVHHLVTANNIRSTDLVDGPLTTSRGDVIIDTSVPSVQGGTNMTASNMLTLDIQATNGVIHAIDQVLTPAPQPD